MNDSGAIHARLRAHGLLDEAMAIVSRHACGVGVLSRDALADMLEMMRARGWSETNARRLLGVEAAPTPAHEIEAFHVDEAPRAPAVPKSRKRLVAWRSRKDSDVFPIADRDDVVAPPAATAPLAIGQRRRSRGGKVLTIVSLGTTRGARARFSSGAEVEYATGQLEALPIAGDDELDAIPFGELPLAERPRLFPGPGPRFDACVHHTDCLGRMLQAFRRSPPDSAHCPSDCRFRSEPSRAERVDEASTGLGGMRVDG